MLVRQRREALDVLAAHLPAVPQQLLEGGIHISGVPEDDSVYNQAKGSELVFLPFAVALSKLAPLAMEDRPREGVASLATIELSEDSAALA